jgi:ribosomal protein S18 acetylase RimI-like enzyme
VSEIAIREYQAADRDEWMRVHAIILTMSHAWNYSIQERPEYERDSVRLVALDGDRIVGLMDVEIEDEPGTLCLLKDSIGGYVLEFGRLPEYKGRRIGSMLIETARERLPDKGVTRMEFWTQDRDAERFYRRIGLREINRHYRFRFRPPADIEQKLREDSVGVEYIYGACVPDVWKDIQKKYDIITRHPLEPHLSVGFEMRF